jgi:hypothetical protein
MQMLTRYAGSAAIFALLAANVFAVPAQAQDSKPDPSGTGGAAGNYPEPPDMSRGMGAPSPDYEPQASEPTNAPPVEAEPKAEARPPAEDKEPAK